MAKFAAIVLILAQIAAAQCVAVCIADVCAPPLNPGPVSSNLPPCHQQQQPSHSNKGESPDSTCRLEIAAIVDDSAARFAYSLDGAWAAVPDLLVPNQAVLAAPLLEFCAISHQAAVRTPLRI